MKSLLKAAMVAAVLAVPAVSFAQQQQPLTRAQVRAELVQLRAAGYDPADWMHYPDNIQAAEAKLQAQKVAQGYGASTNGTSQSSQ
jgi:K+-transporting ATPase c subunit